jgi:hypothetical protein
MSSKSSIGSLLIYLLISLTLVGLAIYMGFNHPEFQIPRRYGELGAITVAVFGTLMKAYWGYRRLVKLWLLLFAAFAAHIAILGFPLQLYGYNWPLGLKIMMAAGEAMCLMGLIYWLFQFIPYSRAKNV